MQPHPFPTHTAADHIGWPAIPAAVPAQMMAVLYQLERSQWWSPEQLRSYQFQQLVPLVAHAIQTVPFYQRQISGPLAQALTQFLNQKEASPETSNLITSNPNSTTLDTLAEELAQAWTQLPILSRETIRNQGETLRSLAPPTSHGSIDSVRTSGSTGKPITVYRTQINPFFWQVMTLREHYWHQRDLSKTLAAIRKFKDGVALYPEGSHQPQWGHPTSLIHQTGPMILLDILTPLDQQLDWLQRQEFEYLITFPTNALALAQRCQEQGIRFPKLQEVRLVGEVVDETVRATCKAAWNVPVTDMYSSQEVGYIALQCPEHEHYHIQSETVYVEIVDEAGQPCKPGEVGRIIVTPLHNFAMPLIRYDIGDYAELGEPCACGRGLPVLNRILGRVRNMLRLPTGEQHWPALGELRYSEVAPVKQHQVVQKSLEELEVRLVVERAVTPAEEAQLREIILGRLSYPFQISFAYPDRIERSRGGKFEEFLSEVA